MKIERNCARCGARFLVHASRAKYGRGVHCSRECQYAAKRERPKAIVQRTCIGCGETFTLERAKMKRRGGGKFCTRACRDKHWVGAVTPNYQGGSQAHRGPHWNRIKRAIRRRDGCCTVCGATERLHVHHVVPFRMFASHEQANHPDNLVTLCDVHHRQVEARHKWVRAGESIIQMNAGGAAWELARERGLI